MVTWVFIPTTGRALFTNYQKAQAMKNTNENKGDGKKGSKKFIFLGLGLGVIAISGFSWWYFGGKKEESGNEDAALPELTDKTNSKPSSNNSGKTKTSGKGAAPKTQNPVPKQSGGQSKSISVFPLKKGSKGEYVKKIQQVLMDEFGAEVLPKYGADGKFGTELDSLLRSKNLPTVIDEKTYNKVFVPQKAMPMVKTDERLSVHIAQYLLLYTTMQNISHLIATLKQIQNVNQYQQVNKYFKIVKVNGKSQSIVEGTFSSFTGSEDKAALKKEFLRIGLKFSGGKWTLGSLEGRDVMTRRETTICCNGRNQKVPANTMLGRLISSNATTTRFRTMNNQVLNVPTKDVEYV
jgi:hypothetical protein